MTTQPALPDGYQNNRELLREILEDHHKEWERLCDDAHECVRLDSSVALEPSDEVQEFLAARDRLVIETTARRLLGLGERRKVLDVLRQRLFDVAHLSAWMHRTDEGHVPAVDLAFQRGCDVARWLLNAKLRELAALGLNAIDLSRQISEVEANIANDDAREKLRVAERLLTNCLPLPGRELARGTEPEPSPLPEDAARDVLAITEDGFRLVDEAGRTRHVTKGLPKRLQRLLLAGWTCGWLRQNAPQECGDDDVRLNAPVSVFFIRSELRRLIGKTASRTNIGSLRNYLRFGDGMSLIPSGADRVAYIDVCVDSEGKADDETLREYMARVLREHHIAVPSDLFESR